MRKNKKKVGQVTTIDGRKIILVFNQIRIIFFLLAISSLLIFTLLKIPKITKNVSKTPIIKKVFEQTNFKNTLSHAIPLMDTPQQQKTKNLDNMFLAVVNLFTGIDFSNPQHLINETVPVFTVASNQKAEPALASMDKSVEESTLINEDENPNYMNGEDGFEALQEDENVEPNESQSGTTSNSKPASPAKNVKVTTVNKIKIRNVAGVDINLNEFNKKPLTIPLSKKGYQVLIVHTHTGESYLQDASEKSYIAARPGYRNWQNNNIVEVGNELKQNLEKMYGLRVLQSTVINDQPYTKSYSNSRKLVKEILSKHPEISIVIDLHRDAYPDGVLVNGRRQYYPWSVIQNKKKVVTIENKPAAKFFCVATTNKNIKNHPKWKENLNIALKLHQKGEQLYPGLMGSIDLREWRFNQDLSPNYMLIEVGSNLNTIQEAKNSTYFLARVLGEVVKEAKK